MVLVKNLVVFVKSFWFYDKVIYESVDHNFIAFVWRIPISICIVAKHGSFNKKKDL